MLKLIFFKEGVYQNLEGNLNISGLYSDVQNASTACFGLIINKKKVLFREHKDWDGVSLSYWQFFREVNRAFCELLKTGNSKIFVDSNSNNDKKIEIYMQIEGGDIKFDIDKEKLYSVYKDLVGLKKQKIELVQSIEEVIAFIEDFKKTFKDIVKNDSPDEIKKYFSYKLEIRPYHFRRTGEHVELDYFDPERWNSLAEIWQDYKTKNNIYDNNKHYVR